MYHHTIGLIQQLIQFPLRVQPLGWDAASVTDIRFVLTHADSAKMTHAQ